MWIYEKKLQYPVKIKNPNPKLAKIIISQLGGPDGELAASTRYLSQRFSMPDRRIVGMLTDIGTEEISHVEMVSSILYQLTRCLSPEEIKDMTSDEINEIVQREFTFDYFEWQKKNKIVIDEPFRADGLETVLYKCPHCQKEGKMEGKGIHLTCHECGKKWELTELGYLKALDGEDIFDHIPDWYRWERECIRKEILDGTYGFDVPCDIYMIVNTKDVYRVGEGRVSHNKEGLHLVGCEGKIDYSQSSKSMYTCEAAFHWYTLGDVIGMGNNRALYFAMPKEDVHVVGKVRLASEEIFKILEEEKTAKKLAKEAVAENTAE
jgi:hypothetical protein